VYSGNVEKTKMSKCEEVKCWVNSYRLSCVKTTACVHVVLGSAFIWVEKKSLGLCPAEGCQLAKIGYRERETRQEK
jgi:hypothetical protein